MSTRQVSGLWTMTKGEFEESVAVLERAVVKQGGNPRELFDLFRTDGEYTSHVADAMVSKCRVDSLSDSIESRLAWAALGGNNIFAAADWMNYYDAKFTEKQLRKAEKFPWGEDVLNSPCPFNKGKLVKDTHFAFLGISGINGAPLTVARWHKLHPTTDQPKFYYNFKPWHAGQPHIDVATMEPRWYLMLKNFVPGSTNKTPEEQMEMIPDGYEVPTTIMEVTKDILVFHKTGKRPNPFRWAACSERTVKTGRVVAGLVSYVGRFNRSGLIVDHWSCVSSNNVGVGASRKL